MTTRPPGAGSYEAIVQRILRPPSDDAFAELVNLVNALPAAPYSEFDPVFATRGAWTPTERPVLADIIRYLKLPGTPSALKNLRAFDGQAIAFDPNSTLYMPLRTACKTLVADARFQVEVNGDFDAALEDILCVLRLAKLLHDQSPTISLLIAIGCERLAISEFQFLARDPRLPRAVLDSMPGRLADIELPTQRDWRATFAFERALMQAWMDDFYVSRPNGDGYLDVEACANWKWSTGVGLTAQGLTTAGGLWNVFSPAFHSRRTCEFKADAMYALLVEAGDSRGTAAFDKLDEYQARAEQLTTLDGPLPLFISATYRTVAQAIHLRMERDALKTMIALEQYRHDHGQLPRTLGALVPDFLEELPLDWYADAPLGYVYGHDTYDLFSLNANRREDAPTSDHPRWGVTGRDDDDFYFAFDRPPSNAESYILNSRQYAVWPGETVESNAVEITDYSTDPNGVVVESP